MPCVFFAKDGERCFDEVDLAEVYRFELVPNEIPCQGRNGELFDCSYER